MIDASNSPEAIGRRLRWLRDLARLTIVDFAKLAGVSTPSISYWENGQIDSPIKSKSMAKVIGGFKKVGFDVNEQWLRNGEGELPCYKGQPVLYSEPTTPTSAAISIPNFPANTTQLATVLGDEIKLFATLEQAVITKVDHGKMAPYLEKGDWVGGVWQNANEIAEKTVCIVKLNNQLHIACVEKSKKAGLFHISYTQEISEHLPLKDVNLEKIAPIIRVWR